MGKILFSGLIIALLGGCTAVSPDVRDDNVSYKQEKLDFSDATSYRTIGEYKFPDSKNADTVLFALYNASIGKVKIVLDKPQDNRLSCRMDFTTETLDDVVDPNFFPKLDSDHDYKITMNELMRTYVGVCTEEVPISSLR